MPTAKKVLPIKVKALEKGFFGGKIRKEDDVFTLPVVTVDETPSAELTEKQFSKKWMVKV